jgi:pimeloyl-ACP methyl ester carboxylesterase
MGSSDVVLVARRLGEFANALPLIVMHGLLGSSRNWQAHGKAMARGRRVFLLDLRNHGASPWSERMDYPAMAADILAFADRHDLDRFQLLGHSMGGKVAIAVSVTAPERVERVVVADIAPVPYAHDFEELIGAMWDLDLARIDRRAAADAALAAAIGDDGVRHFILQNLDFDGDGRAFWKPNLAVLGRSIPTLTGWPADYALAIYEGPVLAIHGGASTYVDAAGEAAFRRVMPAVAFEKLDGAGHWLHVDRPRAFLEAVLSFIEN